MFILTRPPFIQLSTFIERIPTHLCGDSLCVISPRLLNRECPQPWQPPSLKISQTTTQSGVCVRLFRYGFSY